MTLALIVCRYDEDGDGVISPEVGGIRDVVVARADAAGGAEVRGRIG